MLSLTRSTFSRSQGLRIRTYATLAPPSPRHEAYDVVVIGGGISGLALAADLGTKPATRHLKTCLVEASDLGKIEDWKPEEGVWSNRISSVTNENRKWLADIGAWKHVHQKRLGPIQEMQVWDSLTPSRMTFTSPRPTHMATLVENLNLQHSLLTLIRNASSNVDILGSTKVEEIERVKGGKDEWPTVRLSGGKEIKARLVVGADGLRSPVRKFAGIDSHGHSYNTHTIVSILTHDPYPPPPTPHTHTAYQRFLPSGPLAFLPLTDTQASLAWHINPPELSLAVKSLPEETLALMINACFRLPEHGVKHLLARVLEAHQSIKQGGKAISKEEIMSTISLLETSSRSIEPHSPLSLMHPPSPHGIPPKGFHLVPPTIHSFQPGMTASFPLSYSHAESYVLPRVALVGDAAHTVHPHAGMGLNMGLADVRSLTKHLEGAVGVGGDLGSMVSLKGYERERWVANQAVLTATDGLEKMFRTQNSAVRWVRSMGIDVLEELEGIKGLIMKESGGSSSGSSSILPPFSTVVSTGVQTLETGRQLASALGGMASNALKGAISGGLGRR